MDTLNISLEQEETITRTKNGDTKDVVEIDTERQSKDIKA